MNKIQIFTFKTSGKYYTSTNWIDVPKGLMMWSPEFELFVRKNCDINYESSFGYDLVVIDNVGNENFFMQIYKSTNK